LKKKNKKIKNKKIKKEINFQRVYFFFNLKNKLFYYLIKMKLLLNPTEAAKPFYIDHSFAFSGDSGLDLFFVRESNVPAFSTQLIDLEISCEFIDNEGKNKSFWLIPRSSISKTPLRMSNSVGLIDAKYRHSLKVSVDNFTNKDYTITKGSKLFQIVAYNLETFNLKISSNLSESTRGAGFGSSNKN